MKRKCTNCQSEENTGFFTSIFGKPNYLFECDWCKKNGNLNKLCNSCLKYIDQEGKGLDLIRSIDDKYNVKRLCLSCFGDFEKNLFKMVTAINENDSVELVSINYRGDKRTKGDTMKLESDYYEDRDAAIKEIRALAKYHKYDIILDFEIIKGTDEEETESGGTYNYSVWKCKGVATFKG